MSKPVDYLVWLAGCVLLACGVTLVIANAYEATLRDVVVIFALLLACFYIFAVGRRKTGAYRRGLPWLVVPLTLFVFWEIMQRLFGAFDVDAILFHARNGFATGGISDFQRTYLQQAGAAFVATLAGLWILSSRARWLRRIDRWAAVPLTFANPATIAVIVATGWFSPPTEPLLDHYVSPARAVLDNPAPPNVIHIFLESTERTLRDEADFGRIMEPLNALEKRGLSATDLQQAAQTGWTIAGIVSANCGVPLNQPWLNLRTGYDGGQDFRGKAQGEDFMVNAVCLADLLSLHGYKTDYVSGSDLRFAGTDGFLRTHGYSSMRGLNELESPGMPRDNPWGLDDEDVFDAAFDAIAADEKAGERYLSTIVTIGGHVPDGFVSRSCKSGAVAVAQSDPKILMAMECTNRLLVRFLDRLQAAGYLDNTLVVVQNDHLQMRSTIWDRLERHERRDYLAMFGAGIKPVVVDRPATMVDVYPTILEAIGFSLPGDTAGLGVSLLSTSPTLLETLGMTKLDRAIRFDTAFKNWLWGVDEGTRQAAAEIDRQTTASVPLSGTKLRPSIPSAD